jgi:hypothetical protein
MPIEASWTSWCRAVSRQYAGVRRRIARDPVTGSAPPPGWAEHSRLVNVTWTSQRGSS